MIRGISDDILRRVYDFSDMTNEELRCKFFQKLQECIELCNNTSDILEWLKSEGLEKEVNELLTIWLEDGTLEQLINIDKLNKKVDKETFNNTITTINEQFDKIANKSIITVDDFGAKGDGITDDSIALQNAFSWSKSNKKAIYLLDKRYYVTKTLFAGGSIIRSINNVPGDADPYFLKKPDGSYVKSSPYWDYFYNIDTIYTWENMINNTSYGACIISDKDIPILQANTGEMFNIEGIGIVGNHRMKNQIGLYCPTPTEYKGTKQHLKNINVTGCGNNGIHLERGLEVSVIENVKSRYNNGHGLYTGQTSGIDSATEYLKFKDCAFNTNRLDGIHFKYWRKSISFDNIDLGGNGQYQINSIDPLLGYDRRVPNTAEDMRAGIYFEDGNLEQTGIALDLAIKNCWGEMVAKAVHLSATSGTGAINNLNFDNNSFLRVNTITSSNVENGCVYYIDVKYAKNWTIKNTNNHALDMFKFKNIPTNGGNINITDLLPSNVVNSSFYSQNINQPLKTNESITAEKRLYGNQTIVKDLAGDGTTLEIEDIKTDFTKTTANSTSNVVGIYSLTAHWGANNSDKFGGYLLIVTKMPSEKYIMLNVAMSGVDGFTSPPTLSAEGVLSIESVNYYRYTLTRIDNNKTN